MALVGIGKTYVGQRDGANLERLGVETTALNGCIHLLLLRIEQLLKSSCVIVVVISLFNGR